MIAVPAHWIEAGKYKEAGSGPRTTAAIDRDEWALFRGITLPELLPCHDPKPFGIYALLDPRDMRACYVGCTSYGPGARSIAMRRDTHTAGRKADGSFKGAWLRHLASIGLRCLIVTLEAARPELAEQFEEEWISRFALDGEPILNVQGNPVMRI